MTPGSIPIMSIPNAATISRRPWRRYPGIDRPQPLGLQNLTGDRWVTTAAGGAVRDVDPQRSVGLAAGTRINFGAVVAEIQA